MKINEKIERYLSTQGKIINEADGSVIEKLIELITQLPVNKLSDELSYKINDLLDGIIGKDDGNGPVSFTVNKSRVKMLVNKFKKKTMGRKLEKKASKVEPEKTS